MKKYLLVSCLAIALASCSDSGSEEESFEFEEFQSMAMDPEEIKLLEIQNTNGTIAITGSDTASFVNVEITKRVKSYRSSLSAKDHIQDIQISAETKPDRLKIAVDHPNNQDLDYEIDLQIVAPIIFDYTTLLGNGNTSIESVSRNLSITTGNGNILADVILLNHCNVQIEGGNGGIALVIPDISDAMLMATVGNGSISMTGLQLSDAVSTNNLLSGKLGNGEGNITIMLGNGSITLEGY